MTKLSERSIAEAMAKCLTNGRNLVADAELLCASQRYSRAFTMYHCAAEELAKYFMLEIAGRKLANKVTINWGRFWKRIRSHESKMIQAEVRLESLADILKPEQFSEAQEGAAIWRIAGIAPRNRSLYVEIDHSGKAKAPADVDWLPGISGLKALVEALLVGCEGVGFSETEIRKSFHQPSAADLRRPFLKAISDMRDQGSSLEDTLAIFNEAWNLTTMGKKKGRDGAEG